MDAPRAARLAARPPGPRAPARLPFASSSSTAPRRVGWWCCCPRDLRADSSGGGSGGGTRAFPFPGRRCCTRPALAHRNRSPAANLGLPPSLRPRLPRSPAARIVTRVTGDGGGCEGRPFVECAGDRPIQELAGGQSRHVYIADFFHLLVKKLEPFCSLNDCICTQLLRTKLRKCHPLCQSRQISSGMIAQLARLIVRSYSSKKVVLFRLQALVVQVTKYPFPQTGKSTLACTLGRELHTRGKLAYVLDGDNLRHGVNKDLGFKAEDRAENIRRVGEVAKLFADAGLVCIASLISPYRRDRFTGIDDPYEAPLNCEIEIKELDGACPSPSDMARQVVTYLEEKGFLHE
ncbi:hypothetical protein HU200_051680 [Digitaria exilis]|uniref:APS kinase domain-containing protein n=1 Tax=Digitaria exilis TaxID=1010633 RepID=A0A835E527_9POAL|nr:hypothetical protein HU200_051680 [Digitaria exilis]